MGADAILTKIEEKSREEAGAIRAVEEQRAAMAADKLRETARENAQAARERGERDAMEIRTRERLKAGMECRKNALAARRSVVDDAFDKAMEHLLSLEGAEWELLAERLVLEGCMEGMAEVCLSARDTEQLESRMPKLLKEWEQKLTAERGVPCKLALGAAAPIRGGLYFRSAKYDVDASFEMLLRGVREQEEAQIAAILFDSNE